MSKILGVGYDVSLASYGSDQSRPQAVEVGGKEAGLMDEFLLATINPSADRRTVAVSGYVVG